jgi:hypothetical protein
VVERVLAKDEIGVRFPVSAPRKQSARECGYSTMRGIVRGESKGGAGPASADAGASRGRGISCATAQEIFVTGSTYPHVSAAYIFVADTGDRKESAPVPASTRGADSRPEKFFKATALKNVLGRFPVSAEFRPIIFLSRIRGIEGERGAPVEYDGSREQAREERGATATNELLGGSPYPLSDVRNICDRFPVSAIWES